MKNYARREYRISKGDKPVVFGSVALYLHFLLLNLVKTTNTSMSSLAGRGLAMSIKRLYKEKGIVCPKVKRNLSLPEYQKLINSLEKE